MSLKIYDSNQITGAFFGFLVEAGFGEDEFISIERADDAFKTKVGTDGEITRSKTNNKLVTIKVTLMQTAAINSNFAAIALLDSKGNNGAGVGPFMIRDRSGTAIHAGKCWIAKASEPKYGKEATERVWTLQGELSVDFSGGS